MDEPKIHPRRDIAAQWPGRDVFHLILSAREYIVFLDGDLDVDWSTSQLYDEAMKEDEARQRSTILVQAASVECIPNDHHERNIRLNFKRMVGEGIARAFDRDFDSARRMLDQAQSYIEARNIETARYWQLSTAGVLAVIALAVASLLWSFRADVIQAWGEPTFFLLLAGIAGSMGAVLSMIFRMGNSYPTSEAPKSLHVLEAGSRVLAGFISGLLAAASIQVGLILSVLATAGHAHSTMLVVALASGASERFAPSIIGRLESSVDRRQAVPVVGRSKTKSPATIREAV
jgi:hypothetical protein